MVFVPARAVRKAKDGSAVKDGSGKPAYIYGFTRSANPGDVLTDSHIFDGRSIRRIVAKPNGKAAVREAKRTRRAARELATT